MQKWLIVIIFFSSIIPAVHSQNLIMNPSFELYETCPASLATVTLPSEGNPVLKNWNRATNGSPDYFNVCGSDAGRLPNTSLGYQYPRTGKGYMGSFLSDGENYREYFQSKLAQALLPHHYYIGYWLNLANSDLGNIAALDQIGVYFNTDSLESATIAPLSELTPQVVTPPYAILDDTLGWMNIHHTFLASGEERWMIVGSFLEEEDVHYDYFGSFESYHSYYFFDDFCLLDLDVPMDVQDTLFVCQPGDSVNLADYINTIKHFSFWQDDFLSDDMWVYKSGYYTARLVDQGHCKLKDVCFLVLLEVSEYLLDLGTDTFICPGDEVRLDATHPALDVYKWNNGMTDPVLEIHVPGTYSVEALGFCASGKGEIRIDTIPHPFLDIGRDTQICRNSIYIPQVKTNHPFIASYTWNTGDRLPDPILFSSGTYILEIEDYCTRTASDTMKLTVENCPVCFLIPNSFSPNGDGINDYFQVQSICDWKSYQLKIFNRYGNLVFSSFNVLDQWWGPTRNNQSITEVFFYEIIAESYFDEKTVYLKGDITIIQ